MTKPRTKVLRRRALRLEQDKNHPVYLFSLTAAELLDVAGISRVSRDNDGKLLGYQRSDVRQHIKDIVTYLDSPDVVFPNSIILALNSTVKYQASRGPKVNEEKHTSMGILELPVPAAGDQKPAWIVDGQQRALALSHCRRRELVIPISAFIADDVELQRDQFLRINNSKPLPRGLITELLPEVSAPLPTKLAAKRIPAELCDQLNRREESPFVGLIKRSSMKAADKKKAVITDTSIIKMLQESLSTPSGCLFPYRNLGTGETDFEKIWLLLIAYWGGVKKTFPSAWGKAPAKSRLMHGAGILAMGRLMDRIMSSIDPLDPKALAYVEEELQRIKPTCHWTSGRWDELGGLAWNEVQNVPRHISLLSSVLIRSYVHETGRRP